ncbi:MBG domain-containing protein [Blastomonas sp. SL216]|uniref:MBG domain-containing protein n=1 Tax=Blastomonas sp. SL216 TaxID=2995169 RepID=UPI002376EE8B|nr:MBG domain-containing protein [Blastomonas sp. SL216]
MSLYRKQRHGARHFPSWQVALRTGVAGFAFVAAQTAYANPNGGQVVAGQATINGQGTGRVRIDQASDRVVINWDNFSINLGEGVDFRQPNSRSVALNRVTGPEISQIMGELTANGQVYLINGNGIVFGKDAKVDVAGLVATSADIGNEAFMAGGALRFGTPGRAGAKVTNHGTITVRDAGIAAFVAPQVANDGIITAHMGRIAFGGAQAFTLDLHGDNLIRFQVGDAVTKLDDKGALVGIDGVVDARGGSVLITASAARDLVNQSVRIGTPQAASLQTGPDGKVSLVAAKVAITAPGEVQVGRNVAMDLSSATNAVTTGSAKGKGGKASSNTESNIGWVGSLNGDGSAPGQAMATSGSGGTLTISAARTILDGTINLDGSKTGGTAHITGSDFLSFGSILSASGVDAGGKIQLDAGGFSLAGRITVNAALGKGGSVDIRTSRRAIDTGDAFIDASGLHGGSIRYVSDDQIISSGKFRASGSHGFGGNIDVSAPRLDLFSAQFYAQGGIRGGRVRLGGEFQGGQNLVADELPNALRLVATDAVTIDVSAIGMRGNAGEIVIWSDEKTTFLGNAIARGGLVGGLGGQIEISGKETLVYRGTVETARDGQRGGTLLLDPKNIIIADGVNAPSQYGLVLQAFASAFPTSPPAQPGLEAGDGLELAVSLDGNRLALGVRGDDGSGNARNDAGAVYLFSFADSGFSTPVLSAVIGSGYSGGNNISVAALEADDIFGHSVSLDGNRLAVSARGDDGESNGFGGAGAVYLFTFADAAFTGGQLRAVLGAGYSGGSNLSVDNLEAGDLFGQRVSLNGNRLAVGAMFDDGAGNTVQDGGAVYLFTFADSIFSTPSLAGIIGQGYSTRPNDLSVTLDVEDFFGGGVSLDGNRLAVGAFGDDGLGNSFVGGAVYLFSFADATFGSAALEGRIGGGYTGPKDFNLPNLDGIGRDHFGDAVSLDGNRLAVLARLDDGLSDSVANSGAVYLFTFADAGFAAPNLAARIGINYGTLGGSNLSILGMEAGDTLGDVALDGNRLAMASLGDDGRANTVADSGAVYLFTFADAQFNGGRQVGTLGAGYTDALGLSLIGKGLEQSDSFGVSVALNSNRLAVGALQDDGQDNANPDSGAVYLFTFGDARFSGPVLQSIIGSGYSGGKNIAVARLGAGDAFGASVALDGLRLAVGAPNDAGLNDTATGAGAVYLFTFTEADFTGGALARLVNFETLDPAGGTIRANGSQLGTAVALQGNILAVGAAGDAGATGSGSNLGAVHLFDVGGPAFSSTPIRLVTIGKDYTGTNDIGMPDLGESDRFGSAVSLDGLRLAVGAPGDDGFNDDFFNTGAAFLYTFGASNFSGGSLEATIGAFYPGSFDFTPIGIGTGGTDQDFFGSSLVLKGLQLVVGAEGDDGASDSVSNSGAVYLFTFAAPTFGGISQAGVIGAGYSGNISFPLKLNADDGFGRGLAFDGDRLAVGAPGDDGKGVIAGGAGAVYLFTFGSPGFNEARLVDTLGYGYTGQRNLSVSGLGLTPASLGDRFGSAVVLDGLRLAVGAPGNAGPDGTGFENGAVYLFSFADLAFGAPVLEGIIGSGYTGGKNIAMSGFFGPDFGEAIALDGNRLVVAAPGHSGNGSPVGVGVGTVYLFTFADALFTDGALVGRVGQGYTDSQSIDVPTLESFDRFGTAVALRGNSLVVGAPGDDGQGNSLADSGAVYLFTFTDAAFNGGVQQGYIASGAPAAGKNINLTQLDSNDNFGSSAALGASGTRLFIGAPGDAGSGNVSTLVGAVYEFAFSSAAFDSGTLTGTIGLGYTGPSDVNVAGIGSGDLFGFSVAFDGSRLAIGAITKDYGPLTDVGQVYLFTQPSTAFVLSGIIGKLGSGNSDLAIGSLDSDDYFGSSVSLNLNRLVVGARGDDGLNDTVNGAGAVYLISFAGGFFDPPILAGTLGAGYGAQSNQSALLVNSGNNLGGSVALRGNRLAIGVPGSNAANGGGVDVGAVYLFTFLNDDFAAPILAGAIGQGFTGVNNFDVGVLQSGDRFGASVSIDGLRLAIGAPGDDGAADDRTDSGAVYLFSFADLFFGSPVLEARMGRGYTGFKNVAVADLAANDRFGSGVALQGLQLAVGVPGDDGAADDRTNAGAAYLFTFTNTIFNGGERAGTIGVGYNTIAADFSLAGLDPGDRFGTSLSLSGLGLAIGAPGDAGLNDDAPDAGAVYTFTFANAAFGSLTTAATIGRSYDGPNDLSVAGVDAGDSFGASVSLDGFRLAIGSPGDAGSAGGRPNVGAVYLFTFADSSLTTATESGRIGAGYGGALNLLSIVGLDDGDNFGSGVAIDQGRLVIGAAGDDGQSVFDDSYGALYQFTFAENFRSLTQIGLIGSGYGNGPTNSLAAYGIGLNERFGSAVSLQGLALAVGSPEDSGGLSTSFPIGAVYLFSFADLAFNAPVLQSIIGFGYTGGKNIAVANLGANDRFGISVHLSSGGLLTVGADGDDGFGDSGNDRGAAYLFNFVDGLFSGGSLQGIIGSGYSGPGNFDIALDDNDFFGAAVASQEQYLAIGAPGDDGSGNPGTVDNSGAVHLFQLGAGSIGQIGTIGSGYTGTGNFNLAPLAFNDGFGTSLSLQSGQLVVGAPNDEGAGDVGGVSSAVGAVYAFTFTPATPFAGLAHVSTIGLGYTGANDLDVINLGVGDRFGSGVSIDGNRLAIGSHLDGGAINDRTSAGAVYLLSFADAALTSPNLQAIIGVGYTGGKNIAIGLEDIDVFGTSVALDGNRLAVGAPGDGGAGNILGSSGAVYLFTFADAAFNNGKLAGTLGAGYRRMLASNLAAPAAPILPQVGGGDSFGSAVSLDGLRLAIGAQDDDGSTDSLPNAGAVYLFTFADLQFGGAALQSVIGHGYVGGKNIFVTQLDGGDRFGAAVSLDGNRLAVGAPFDSGASNSVGDSGAVYLFSFADALFGGGTLEAIAGADYSGGKNLTVADLQASDRFGTSVSLDGNRLAVGAVGDDAAGNPPALARETGAVYLFSFAGPQFQSGALEAILGLGFDAGSKDLDILNLEDGDAFGWSVSLDGTRLAVGARGDDGDANSLTDAGAVYLFTFTDLVFAGGVQQGIVGASYNGPGDIDNVLTPFGMGSSSFFGSSVALDGNRLAIGGPRVTSTIASPAGSGAVYLLTFADSSFGGGTIVEILGKGAPNFGANADFDVALDAFDLFGSTVSLDGNRLVVGAPGDDGFGNSGAVDDSGAVYLFTFADAAFAGARLAGNIGSGYTRGASTPVAGVEAGEFFGWALSLDGTRLAVGSSGDNGAEGLTGFAGAVYLFTFGNLDFGAPTLQGILGAGYTGAKSLDVPGIAAAASFGGAVSLDGNRLAVGASNLVNGGTVYLFTFSDALFSSPVLASRIGAGLVGPNDLSVSTEGGDFFGYSVSLDGNRLAVGALGDDGASNSLSDSGAVYLFSFADAAFAGPVQEAIIGSGYTGGKNIDLAALQAGDFFGSSVSLQGLRLAVGAENDDGFDNSAISANSGAVYLFTMAAPDFSGITRAGTIGRNYTGAGDLNIGRLGSNDWFGRSVSLDGNRLVVGAVNDAGATDSMPGSGAVYLLGFADAAFGTPSLLSIFGSGYSGAADINVAGLDTLDFFGNGLSLDAGRLVIGAPFADGPDNLVADSGAVYFFNLSGGTAGLPGLGFGDNPGADVTISATALAAILSGGTGVTLQANNDITINSAITVNNSSGNGGNLRFQAGRSIFVNAGITTDNGRLDLLTNNILIPGAIDAFRDPGAAVITFGAGGFVNAGTGDVFIEIGPGANLTHPESGAITLGNITAGTINVLNAGFATPGQEVIIPSGVVLNASGSETAITVIGGIFTNNGGPGAFNMTGGGRFLVYSNDYDVIERGGLVGNNLYNRGFQLNPPGSITQPGNLFIFFRQPILTFTADDVTRTYGQPSSGYTFLVSGLVNGDTDSYAYSGLPNLFDTASGNAGLDSIFIDSGSLFSDVGYGFNFVGGTLTTLKALLTVTADDTSREYGLGNPLFTASYSGFVNGDDASVISGLDFLTVATTASDVGTYAITPFGASANNYDFSYVPGTLTITKALLTVTADNASREYGLANPVFTGNIAGFRNGDTPVVISGLTYATVATTASPIGTYAITGSGATATNYDFSYIPGTLTITKALLTVTADNATREYGLANPTFTGSITGFRNGDTSSVISGLTYGSVATTASPVGTYAITGSGASATNYDFSYVPGTLTITKALLTVTADNATREYGLANPTFTGLVTGFRNGDTSSVISGLTYGSVATTASPVGTYAITGSGATATNYDFSYVPGTLTITKALLTVTADNASREYGLANPTFTGSITGFRNGDTASVVSGLTYGSVATTASPIGTYAITGSGATATNYDFSYVPGTLTITRALLTVTADNATREYGLANPTFTGTISGLRAGDTASVVSGLVYGTTATAASNVGTFAITASGGTAANYDFAYVPGTLTITRALLTVTADNASREYGLANPTFTGSVTGFRNGDTSSVISGLTYGSVATTATPVGTYAITGSGASATNYDFAYVPGTLTITRALLTVTADNATREYGLANPTFTGSITGFRNGDTASVVSGLTYGSVATTASPIGTYAITGSGATATNYDFSYVPGTLTITRALLTITADNASREYGLANPTFTGTISGLRAGDTASVVSGLVYGTTATTSSNVGTFAITASGGSAANYNFAYVPGTLTITRALLTVTADNASREYGLANPTFTGSISGFRNSDTASVISGLVYGSAATAASNVGTFAITGSGASATNYDFAYVPGTLTITRALLTVTANNATREYGLADPAFTGSITGFRNSDTTSVVSGLVYGSTAVLNSGIGTYAINGSGASATNYDFAYVPGTLTITRALLTVTADSATREYGLPNPVFTGTISGFRAGDTASVISGLTFGSTHLPSQGVGTYAINGAGASATNYNFAYVPGTLTITKALLTVTADNASREYGLANPTFTGTVTGFRNGDTSSVISGLTYGSVATTASPVGTYAITGSGATATNYDFSYVPGTLTITKALLTVTADNASREYGLANPTFTGSITGFRNGDTASVVSGLTYGSVATTASPIGTYAITGSGATATNYDFSYVPGTLTITRALLTVTADNASREYGLANPTFTGTISGLRAGDTASVVSGLVYGTTATAASNIGTFAITASGGSAANYDFAYVPGTLTITRALLTVTADNASREYGLANPTFTGSITGFRNGDTSSVISGLTYGSVATTASPVGTYAITGSGASATNYDFAYVPGTLTITRALLTVTADNASREYGLANPTFTGSVTGFRNGDTASVISGLVYGSNAVLNSGIGTYAITGSGATSTNYDFSYVPGTLTITRALLTVTADNATREYGLANPTFTGTISGLRAGDTASVVSGLVYGTTATAASNIGTFAITASGGTAANYDFAYVPGTLTITKALLTVTANNASREYGLANPAFTGSVTGFRNGDTASVISGLVYGSVATIASNAGSYAITGSGGTAANYDFAYVPGTLTITKALLTVTANNASREYGLANPTFTGSVTGFRNGDTASVISGLVYGSVATTGSAVGSYAITGSGASATNYDFGYVPGTLTITRALLTVTADNASREYGLANPTFTGTIAGFRNGDTASVISGLTFGTVATAGSAVGSYAITGSGASATNYDFAYVPGTLTITRALLTITADNASREYGLANPAFTGTISGLRNGDTASVISGLTFGSVAVTGSNVGSYAITGSGASAANYNFAYVPGTLTVTRARLTVTADGKTREYGLVNPALTSTISGLRNGDAASVVSGIVLSTSATQASGVGSYAIGVSGGSALNYDFDYVPGTLAITPATLTVAIDSKTRQYGAANPALTASISGFRNGDTEQAVTGLRLNTGANARSNVGNYVILGSGAAAANYRFDYVPGTMTITKALLQVRVNNASREYGLANPVFTASISGLRNGDTASVVTGLTFGTPATIGSDVGIYAITASGGSALNYDFSYIPGRLTINQAQLLITADSKTMTQGSSDPLLTVSYSGLRNGDTKDVVTGLVLRSSGGGNAAPGQYVINASRGTARNYQITYRPGVMTVLPAVAPPAQNPPGTGGSPNPPTTSTPPVVITVPPITLPIAGGNVTPPPATGTATPDPAAAPLPQPPQAGTSTTAPAAGTSATASVMAMPAQGAVNLPVPPESLSPMQVLQGLSAPLPVLVSPELRPADSSAPSGASQGDRQRSGCEYISLCNGTAVPLWSWQPVQ